MKVADGSSRKPADAAETRKRALIHHTRAQMMASGIENVSLNAIMRLAGGSKATVAKYFGNKNGLISAALEESARDGMSRLAFEDIAAEPDLTKAAARLVRVLLGFYTSSQAIATYRGVIATSGSLESRAALFYTNGHLVVVAEVAKFLGRWKGKGIGRETDLERAAGRLTHMVRSDLFERKLLGLAPEPYSEDEIARFANETARLFVHGIAER